MEPDKRNYRKLCENTKNIRDLSCINAAADDKDGELYFEANKGRGARAGAAAGLISAVSVDKLISESDCGEKLYIKIDVEGNELNVIRGAEKTIKKYRPFIKTACYHRSGDIFSLPLKIFEMNPAYKLYMRHSPHVLAWDTEYYFAP